MEQKFIDPFNLVYFLNIESFSPDILEIYVKHAETEVSSLEKMSNILHGAQNLLEGISYWYLPNTIK